MVLRANYGQMHAPLTGKSACGPKAVHISRVNFIKISTYSSSAQPFELKATYVSLEVNTKQSGIH